MSPVFFEAILIKYVYKICYIYIEYIVMVIVSTSIFNDGVMSVIEQFVSPGCCTTRFYPCLWSAPLRKDSLRGLSLWR